MGSWRLFFLQSARGGCNGICALGDGCRGCGSGGWTGRGYWHRIESCQVTLISEHDLKLAGRGNAFDFSKGSHRRNLVVAGLKAKALQGRVFRIGGAVFAYDKPRPPCGYLNKIEGRGMALALSYNSGFCLRVVQSGRVAVGDEIEILQ